MATYGEPVQGGGNFGNMFSGYSNLNPCQHTPEGQEWIWDKDLNQMVLRPKPEEKNKYYDSDKLYHKQNNPIGWATGLLNDGNVEAFSLGAGLGVGSSNANANLNQSSAKPSDEIYYDPISRRWLYKGK